MATRQNTRRDSRYLKPGPEAGLVAVRDDALLESGSMVERLTLLWESRNLLYRWVAIGLAVSVMIAFVIPARYTTTTRLMPPDKTGAGAASMLAALSRVTGDLGSTGGSDSMGSIGGELLGLKTSGDLFVGVLKSETVQNALVNRFDLRKVYRDRRWKDARDDLEDRTDASADRKTGIITIKVSDRNPQRAAAMGREYVNQLNQVVVTLDTSAAHRERVFLESRLSQVQQDLEIAEKDFSQFSSKNAALDVKEQGKAMIGATAELEGQLIAAETQLAGLRQIYMDNNVRVRSVRARIEEYRRQLQKLGGEVPPAGETGSSESGNQSPNAYPTIRQLPLLGVTWADLYRRSKVEEAVFETLTKQSEMAKVEEARETPSIKILDVAEVPEKRSFPPRLLIILFGTFLAFGFSAVWVLASTRWQEIDARDPGKRLAVEICQTIEARASRIGAAVTRRFDRRTRSWSSVNKKGQGSNPTGSGW